MNFIFILHVICWRFVFHNLLNWSIDQILILPGGWLVQYHHVSHIHSQLKPYIVIIYTIQTLNSHIHSFSRRVTQSNPLFTFISRCCSFPILSKYLRTFNNPTLSIPQLRCNQELAALFEISMPVTMSRATTRCIVNASVRDLARDKYCWWRLLYIYHILHGLWNHQR